MLNLVSKVPQKTHKFPQCPQSMPRLAKPLLWLIPEEICVRIPVRNTQEALPASRAYSSGIPGVARGVRTQSKTARGHPTLMSQCWHCCGLTTEDTLPCFWVPSGMHALLGEACQKSKIPFKGHLSLLPQCDLTYGRSPRASWHTLPSCKSKFLYQGSIFP